MKLWTGLVLIFSFSGMAQAAPSTAHLTLENSCLFTKGKSFVVQSVLETKGSATKKISQFFCRQSSSTCQIIEIDISGKKINSRNVNAWSVPLEHIKIGENSASFSYAKSKFSADSRKGVSFSQHVPGVGTSKKGSTTETWTGSCQ